MTFLRKRKRWLVALIFLLLLGILAAAWQSGRPLLSKALAAREQLNDPGSALSPQKRSELLQQLHQTLGQLSPAERKEFWAERRQQFRDWLDDFFQAPRQEQIARLDAEIDRMDDFRRRNADQVGNGWAGGLSDEDLLLRQKQWIDLTTAEERAQVDRYFDMLAQQRQQRSQGNGTSPWGGGGST
jgi:hypothetical protein